MKKREFREKRKNVIFPVYFDYRVVIIKTNNKQKSYDRIRKLGKNLPPDADFKAVHVWISDQHASYLIFPEDADVNMIVHECWHVIRYLVEEWAGAHFDNELVAYHLGYLTQIVYDFINS